MLVLAALLLVNFLLFALTRRLNFDESLALHAGWLSFNEVPAQPFFYMPFSLVLGWLATLIEDPGRLFVTLRLAAVLSLLLVLLLLVWRLGLKGRTTLFAVLLLFANGGFLSHGYEFRYDLAVLLGWLLGFVALQERSRAGLILLGLCIGWLAIHHLKGVYFAGWLYLFGLLRLQLDRGLRPGSLLPYHLALLLPALLWAGYSLLSGRSGELIGFYSGFILLSLEAQKVWPWESMLRRLVLDGPWWWLVLPASIGALLMRRERWLRWAAGFVLVGGLFPFVHPHPWPIWWCRCCHLPPCWRQLGWRRLWSGPGWLPGSRRWCCRCCWWPWARAPILQRSGAFGRCQWSGRSRVCGCSKRCCARMTALSIPQDSPILFDRRWRFGIAIAFFGNGIKRRWRLWWI
ncbi:hypothetical protein [Candidatus Endoriftia persephonae]|uniref:Uncharacterized protein n=3 Tax=Gammaproteobacteria TaxID=1236 RepID=G2FCG6_9GAMM|nr:hypothetical protein [Candidatus Endoriftia persephone]EGW55529.1 hypothetical protein TevJSym_ac00920 [endosymbiont of Tevnia jerichonana (vent Tica)]USF86679.1 hypothetical protein L0Y14_11080 [Candidatus Endoriftia persephone]